MNRIAFFFKSKAYKEGFRAGEKDAQLTSISNPYSDDATWHNIEHGMGASPWWDTNYQPFIDWNLGRMDAHQPALDKYFEQLSNFLEDEQP
jgi:hypothetical protein